MAYKTIGILGGMGPEATADVYMKIIRWFQEERGAKLDSDFPRIVVESIPLPDILESTQNEKEALQMLRGATKRLKRARCEVLIVACNSVHHLIPQFTKGLRMSVVHIADAVADELESGGKRKVALLGTEMTIAKRMYEERLEPRGIEVLALPRDEQYRIMNIIRAVLAGTSSAREEETLAEISRAAMSRGAEAVVLGCTELPLVGRSSDIPYIDANAVLAKAAARAAHIEGCAHCGSNPVNHFSTWLGNTLATLSVSRSDRTTWSSRLILKCTDVLVHFLFTVFLSLGVARLTEDPEKAVSGRGKVLWEEARRRGIPFRGIALFGKQTDAYCTELGGKTRYFVALPRPIQTESNSENWLDDKAVLKEKLAAAGIPVPRGGSYTRFFAMARDFEALEKPVIVKPRVGSRGRHTTTHIHTLEELRKAFEIAKKLCRSVVMEEHLVGSVYRGTLIGGKLVGVLAGDPPRVVGDGRRTIADLVPIKNEVRHPKVSPVVLDDRHADFLRRTGRSFKTVPAAGEVVDLLGNPGLSYGGNSREVTAATHPEIKQILARAGAVVNDPIIGFDFIIADIAGDPATQKWGIIECNSTPFINLHHDPVEGEPVNVAAHVWDYVLGNPHRF